MTRASRGATLPVRPAQVVNGGVADHRREPRHRAHHDDLSAQETQIASMAIQGLTTREIGERLYISHRMVGSHLYRMFPKLGISSRTELLRLAAERERT